MNQRKKLYFLISGMLIIFLIFGAVFWGNSFIEREEPQIVIKDNVKIITANMPQEDLPIEVNDTTIIFSKDVNYEVGDIIVAGIIDTAPDGFIRRVTSVTEKDGLYKYETEYALLTDVFEEIHIVKSFRLLEDNVYDMNSTQDNILLLSKKNFEKTNLSENVLMLSNTTRDLLFEIEFEHKLAENVDLIGKLGVDSWIEIKLDIADENVVFGIVSHTQSNGEVVLGYSRTLSEDGAIPIEKTLFEKRLPNFEFSIGTIPIVVTNDFSVNLEGEIDAEGSIGTSIGIGSERVVGFEYTSQNGNIQQINEKEYLGNGVEWNTETRARCDSSMGVFCHLVSKLYGSTGADISVGIEGAISGDVSIGLDKQGKINNYGYLSMGIYPKAQGSVVVSVPIVDEKLAECPLFELEMPPFWEETWEKKANSSEEIVLSDVYQAYLDVLMGNERLIKSYNWQMDIGEEYSSMEKQVALCDLNEDSIPELLFFTAENDYRAFLNIYSYENGSVQKCRYNVSCLGGEKNYFSDDLVASGTAYIIQKNKDRGKFLIYHSNGDMTATYEIHEYKLQAGGNIEELNVITRTYDYMTYEEDFHINGVRINQKEYMEKYEALVGNGKNVILYSLYVDYNNAEKFPYEESLAMSYNNMYFYLKGKDSL